MPKLPPLDKIELELGRAMRAISRAMRTVAETREELKRMRGEG